MWVFGYGSLMWDGWENTRGCTRRMRAELQDYQRAFNKPSVWNWGTKERPCPTLSVVKAGKSSCRGIAFEFPDDKEREIRAYLIKREGKGFDLRTLSIRLDDGTSINGLVAVYDGDNIIEAHDLRALGRQIRAARGKDGPCVEYIQGIARKLEKEGITDPVVTDLAAVVAQDT